MSLTLASHARCRTGMVLLAPRIVADRGGFARISRLSSAKASPDGRGSPPPSENNQAQDEDNECCIIGEVPQNLNLIGED